MAAINWRPQASSCCSNCCARPRPRAPVLVIGLSPGWMGGDAPMAGCPLYELAPCAL